MFLIKYRLLSANEDNGDYIVTASFAGTAANGRLRPLPKAPMLNRRGTPSAGGSCMPRRRCFGLTFVVPGRAASVSWSAPVRAGAKKVLVSSL
jgi:hypothetical protein